MGLVESLGERPDAFFPAGTFELVDYTLPVEPFSWIFVSVIQKFSCLVDNLERLPVESLLGDPTEFVS